MDRIKISDSDFADHVTSLFIVWDTNSLCIYVYMIYVIYDIYIYIVDECYMRHFFRHVHQCHVSELVNDYQLGMF